MMIDGCKAIRTTVEVWRAVLQAHPEIKAFATYSAPCGDRFGDPFQSKMQTAYGFDGCEFPTMGATTTWDFDYEHPDKRTNEETSFFLYVAEKEVDQ